MLLKTISLMYLALQGSLSVSPSLNETALNETDFSVQNHNISNFYGCFEQEKEDVEPCFRDLVNQGYNLTAFKDELEEERLQLEHRFLLAFKNYTNKYKTYYSQLYSINDKVRELSNSPTGNCFPRGECANLWEDERELNFLIESRSKAYQKMAVKVFQPFSNKTKTVEDILQKINFPRQSLLDGKTPEEIDQLNLEEARSIVQRNNLTYTQDKEDDI